MVQKSYKPRLLAGWRASGWQFIIRYRTSFIMTPEVTVPTLFRELILPMVGLKTNGLGQWRMTNCKPTGYISAGSIVLSHPYGIRNFPCLVILCLLRFILIKKFPCNYMYNVYITDSHDLISSACFIYLFIIGDDLRTHNPTIEN